MNKGVIYSIVLGGLLTVSSAQAVNVFGSVEQGLQIQNGVHDIVNGDTYVGVSTSEDLGNGNSAIANISLSVDSEAANATATRDAYVGLVGQSYSVKLGRMTNVQGVAGDNTVDIFEGNGVDADGATRASNTIGLSYSVGGVTLLGSHTTDGSTGNDTQDSYEVGATANVGLVNVVGVYALDRTTDIDTIAIGGNTTLNDITVGGVWERDETAAGAESDSFGVVASTKIGSNTLKIGHKDNSSTNDYMVYEAVHNYSKNTSTYLNVKDEDNTDNVTTLGLRVKF